MSARNWLATGAVLAGLGVAAGAFGAHGLRDLVSVERVAVFETAVRYHLVHALALIFVGFSIDRWGAAFSRSGFLFLAGLVLFSGSLYVLVLTDTSWLGAITPVGGVAFLGGWALFAWDSWKVFSMPSRSETASRR